MRQNMRRMVVEAFQHGKRPLREGALLTGRLKALLPGLGFLPLGLVVVLLPGVVALSALPAAADTGARNGSFGAHTHLNGSIFGTNLPPVSKASGGPLAWRTSDSDHFSTGPGGRGFFGSASADAVGHVLEAQVLGQNAGAGTLYAEMWDTAIVSGSCPTLPGLSPTGDPIPNPNPANLGPCIEINWEVDGRATYARKGLSAEAYINHQIYAGVVRSCGPGCFNYFLEPRVENIGHASAGNCNYADNCTIPVNMASSFTLPAAVFGSQFIRSGDTIAWWASARLNAGTGYAEDYGNWPASAQARVQARLIVTSRDPAVSIGFTAAVAASGREWKQLFDQWEANSCPPFVPGNVPRIDMTVAFIPVRYRDGMTTLTFEEVAERIDYIKDYFYQQSMCSVVLNPWVVRDPATNGWLTLPFSEAEYYTPPIPDSAAQLGPLARIWLDAFMAASFAQPEFLLRQQAVPPFGGFDAVYVIETTERRNLRGRAFINRDMAAKLPTLLGGVAGLLGAIAPPAVDLLGPILGALGAVFPTGLELATVLPGFVATLENTLFKQASVIISDTLEINPNPGIGRVPEATAIWAHELGHALFNWWDYYGTPDVFCRGDITADLHLDQFPPATRQDWGLMAGAMNAPPPPATTYDRANAGWMGPPNASYRDIPSHGFGDYTLIPLRDYRFWEGPLQAFRYRAPRGLTDWFLFELRMPPDNVPRAPEHRNVPELRGTWEDVFFSGIDGWTVLRDLAPNPSPFPANRLRGLYIRPNANLPAVFQIRENDLNEIYIPGDQTGSVAIGDSYEISRTPGFGQTGVVVYRKREINFLKWGHEIPVCGGVSGAGLLGLNVLFGNEFGSCLTVAHNNDTPGCNNDMNCIRRSFTLLPGGPPYIDDDAGVEFELRTDRVLSIRGSPTSRTVVRLEAGVLIPEGGFPGTIAWGTELRPQIDLHVVAQDGRHVGPNYETGQYELEINGARGTGPDLGYQWISLPDNVAASYVIDASPTVPAAQALGLSHLDIQAIVSFVHYDEAGVPSEVLPPLVYNLSLAQPTTGPIPIPLGPPQDSTPPVTAAAALPNPNANGWNNTDVTISLTATDDAGGTGVKEIRFALSGAQAGGGVTLGNAASVTISTEGVTTLSYFAVDNAGNQEAPKTLTIQIDKTPPVISGLPASACTLWPPNHKLVQVATLSASDGLSGLAPGSLTITGSSNEPENGLGDGDAAPDIVITGGTVYLRAERSGTGTGRIYSLTAMASDLAGNLLTATATCTVPKDQRK